MAINLRIFSGFFLLSSFTTADIPVYGKGLKGVHTPPVVFDTVVDNVAPVAVGGKLNVVSDIDGGLYRAPLPVYHADPIYNDEVAAAAAGIHGGGIGKGLAGPFGGLGSVKGHVYGLFPHEYVTGISSAYLVKSDLSLPGLYGHGIPHPPNVLHSGPGLFKGPVGVHGPGFVIRDSYGPPHVGYGKLAVGGGHAGAFISGPAVSFGKGPILDGSYTGPVLSHGIGPTGHFAAVGPVGKGHIINGGPALSHGISVGPVVSHGISVGPAGFHGKGAIFGGHPVLSHGVTVGPAGKGTVLKGGPVVGHGISVGPVGPIGKGAVITRGPVVSHEVSVGHIGPIGKGGIVSKGPVISSPVVSVENGAVVTDGGFLGPHAGGLVGGHINSVSVIDAPGEVFIGGPTKGSAIGSITGAYVVPH